jgi:hypothetical protein
MGRRVVAWVGWICKRRRLQVHRLIKRPRRETAGASFLSWRSARLSRKFPLSGIQVRMSSPDLSRSLQLVRSCQSVDDLIAQDGLALEQRDSQVDNRQVHTALGGLGPHAGAEQPVGGADTGHIACSCQVRAKASPVVVRSHSATCYVAGTLSLQGAHRTAGRYFLLGEALDDEAVHCAAAQKRYCWECSSCCKWSHAKTCQAPNGRAGTPRGPRGPRAARRCRATRRGRRYRAHCL